MSKKINDSGHGRGIPCVFSRIRVTMIDSKRVIVYASYATLALYILLVAGNFWKENPIVALKIVTEKPYMFAALVLVYLVASYDIGIALLLSVALVLTLFDVQVLTQNKI